MIVMEILHRALVTTFGFEILIGKLLNTSVVIKRNYYQIFSKDAGDLKIKEDEYYDYQSQYHSIKLLQKFNRR